LNQLEIRRADGLCGDGYLVEDGGPFFSDPGGVGLLVEGVAGDEGESQGGLGVDHLFVGEIDLCSKEPEVRLNR
jgi:hypothetical protein